MTLRRLIGPMVITLATCILWVDYVFFRDYSWSIVGFLAKTLEIFFKIFSPLFNPELYSWVGETAIPAGMVLCALALLYLSVTKAKGAMRQATPPVDEPLSPGSFPLPKLSHEAKSGLVKPVSKPWRVTLAGKLTSSFAILAILFGTSVSIIAYAYLAATIEQEMKRRASLSVIGLSEIAERHGNGRGELQLRHALDDYALDAAIAYVYVEDAAGRIIAHVPRELPTFLLRDFPRTAERAINGIEVLYRDLPVYEIAARVGENKFGYVHLAIWRHAVDAETRRIVTSIVLSIVLLLCATVAVFAWAIWYFTLPLSNFGLYAHRVSKGELDLDIEIKENEALKENNEVGSLARSFARMRSSLHAILTRLESGQQADPSNHIR